jgi:hypothetical protein
MANHCYNWIEIEFKKKDFKKLKNWLNNYESFDYLCDWVNFIISEKNRLSQNYAEEGKSHSYGGRWFDYTWEERSSIIYINGDSAWSPMDGMCKAISKEFECTVRINYEEPSCDFGGEIHYVNGEENIIFIGSYNQYQYYLDGIYAMYQSFWAEDFNDIEDFFNDWSKIIESPEDIALLNKFVEQKKMELKQLN